MFQNQLSQKSHVILVFVLALVCIGIQTLFIEKKTPYADNISYMAVALPLYENGVYEDGNFKGTVLAPAENGEGMFFPPLYPAFLTGMMFMSDTFTQTARCSIEHIRPKDIEPNCNVNYDIVVGVQVFLGALSCAFIWLSAQLLFNRPLLSWGSAILVATLGTLATSASTIMPEALILVLFYGATYFMLSCLKHPKTLTALLCGVFTGLLLLTKPAFLYVVYFTALIFVVGGFYMVFKARSFRVFLHLLVVILGVVIIVGPWVYRNHSAIGYANITYGYGPFTLAQRVAYNEMTWTEWWVSWIYGIPGEGDSIAEKLFDEKDYVRWSYDHPDSFYIQGNRVLRGQTKEEAGGHEEHLSYLIKNHVVADLPWHIMTTFPIVFRGMWVFELWLFIPYVAFLFLLWHCFKRREYDYVLYAMVAWFMLGLHAFVSVNIPRYNLPMQGSLAVALSWALTAWWDKYRLKKTKKHSSA